jgi:hypothetical protein
VPIKNSQSTAKRTSTAARDLAAVVSPLLADLRGVTVQTKSHNASYLIRKKVFAFTRKDGVAVKLPEARIRQLIEQMDVSFLVMGKRSMREWALIRHANHSDFAKDLTLFRESIAFVSSLEA